MLFDKFKNEFDNANVNLSKFFKKDFDENYAKVIATTALNEYLKFAFENHQENLQFWFSLILSYPPLSFGLIITYVSLGRDNEGNSVDPS